MGQIRIIVDGPECIEPGCSNRTARRVHPRYNPIGQHRLRCDVCHDARAGKSAATHGRRNRTDGPECIEPGCSNSTPRRKDLSYEYDQALHHHRCNACHHRLQREQEQRMDAFLDRQYQKEQSDLRKGLAATRTAPHKDSQGNPQPWGKTTRARKYWQCEMCGDEIHPGDDYLLVTTYPQLLDYPQRTPVCATCSGRPLR